MNKIPPKYILKIGNRRIIDLSNLNRIPDSIVVSLITTIRKNYIMEVDTRDENVIEFIYTLPNSLKELKDTDIYVRSLEYFGISVFIKAEADIYIDKVKGEKSIDYDVPDDPDEIYTELSSLTLTMELTDFGKNTLDISNTDFYDQMYEAISDDYVEIFKDYIFS